MVEANITHVDLGQTEVLEKIRDAEYWAIGTLKRAELWTTVYQQITSGEIYETLFNASMYYAAAKCLALIYASGGERSQKNFPESFSQRSVGGLSAGQPDWRKRYDDLMREAKQELENFVEFMQGEEQSSPDNMLAQVSNRDFEAAFDNAFGISGSDFDFF